jgi:hypothetical protein
MSVARRTRALCAALAAASGCGSPTPQQVPIVTHQESSMTPTSADADLTQKLVADGYGKVFTWPQHDVTMSRLWDMPGNPAKLEAMIDDRTAPIRARLVAAEVLFTNDFTFLARHDPGDVARIYADALVHHVAPNANLWGLLWLNHQAGLLGGRFVMLERDAIPALVALLENPTVVDYYEGSEDATLGNGARYRIKDFAAFYLMRIVGHPIPFRRDFAGRDVEIAGLRAVL